MGVLHTMLITCVCVYMYVCSMCMCMCAVYDSVERSDTVGHDNTPRCVYMLYMTLSSVLIQLVIALLNCVCQCVYMYIMCGCACTRMCVCMYVQCTCMCAQCMCTIQCVWPWMDCKVMMVMSIVIACVHIIIMYAYQGFIQDFHQEGANVAIVKL